MSHKSAVRHLKGYMNTLRKLHPLCLLALLWIFPSPVSANPPDERDGQVLQALMLHLLADPKFELNKVSANEATIVLHAYTPEKTGFLQSGQIRGEIDKRELPTGAESDMRRRNTPANAKANSYEAVKASYTNLTFSAPIVVSDLTDIWKGRWSDTLFKKAHPQARGWLKAYLPGYSKDGSQAMIRASVGPTEHSAMLTAVLEKSGDKWVVVWHYIAYFL